MNYEEMASEWLHKVFDKDAVDIYTDDIRRLGKLLARVAKKQKGIDAELIQSMSGNEQWTSNFMEPDVAAHAGRLYAKAIREQK